MENRSTGLVHRRRRRSCHAGQHRIDRLEVTGVGRHADDERLRPAIAIHLVTRARVILHVAHPAEIDAARAREEWIFELGEHLSIRLLQDVREHV